MFLKFLDPWFEKKRLSWNLNSPKFLGSFGAPLCYFFGEVEGLVCTCNPTKINGSQRFPMFGELDREDLHELAREFQGPFYVTWRKNMFLLGKVENSGERVCFGNFWSDFGFDELVLSMCWLDVHPFVLVNRFTGIYLLVSSNSSRIWFRTARKAAKILLVGLVKKDIRTLRWGSTNRHQEQNQNNKFEVHT